MLFSLLAACRGDSAEPVEVVSLRDNLPQMEAAVRAWRADAYLEDADLPIQEGNPSTRLLSAGYNSLSTQFESLLVTIRQDGSIEVERIAHTAPVTQVDPIATDDWSVDSPEALELALDAAGRAFLEAHADMHCSFMKLERRTGEPGEPVVWRMVLTECLDGDSLPDVYIDPITGEVWTEG